MQTLFFFSFPSLSQKGKTIFGFVVHKGTSHVPYSSSQRSAAALNQLNLLRRPDAASVASRELITIEKDALGRGNGRKSCGGRRANTPVCAALPRLLQGTVLLRALAVLGKGNVRGLAKVFGEGVGG